jgi:phage-related protein
MSLTLPSALIAEKNKTSTTSAWLWFLEITLPDSTVLRYVRNTEAMTYGGNRYEPIYFKMSGIQATTEAGIPQVQLSIADPGRVIRAYVNDNSGLEDSDITLSRVNTKNLAEDHSELEYSFRIAGYSDNNQDAVFTLAAPNLLNRRFPLHEVTAVLCDHVYKDSYCAATSTLTSCDGTWKQCIERNNQYRFGGEFALQHRARIIV